MTKAVNLDQQELQVVTTTNLENIAEEIAFQGDYHGVLEFILRIDQHMCNLEFTTELYARLGDAIRAEYVGDPEQLSLLDIQDAITPE